MADGYGVLICPYCGKKFHPLSPTNHNGFCYFNGDLTRRAFCSADCYENYKEQFVVNVYSDLKIYCVKVGNEKRYMPYWGCAYYFTDIEECNAVINLKVVQE